MFKFDCKEAVDMCAVLSYRWHAGLHIQITSLLIWVVPRHHSVLVMSRVSLQQLKCKGKCYVFKIVCI